MADTTNKLNELAVAKGRAKGHVVVKGQAEGHVVAKGWVVAKGRVELNESELFVNEVSKNTARL